MNITVERFYEAIRATAEAEIVSGRKHLQKVIREPAINRPGLALADFFQYFAHLRVQVFGLAEMTYLKSLPVAVRGVRVGNLFMQGIPCVVLTRNRHATPEIQEMAAKYRVPVFRTPMITGRFINTATLALEAMLERTEHVPGTMLDVQGLGVLVTGQAGIGKSEAALGLIARGHSLVSDDVCLFRRSSTAPVLIGTAPEAIKYHMEIRGLGPVHIPSLFGMASITHEKQLDLVIDLVRHNPADEPDRSGLHPGYRNILDLKIPHITLPVAPGRDMSGVIEVAAMNHKLRLLGHDAAKEFNDRLIHLLQERAARTHGRNEPTQPRM
ncbi:MAG: HPr(Ser) kinase/phosphatase [Kiritimatiellia bacterium]